MIVSLFLPIVCPGVRESSQQVIQVRDSYRWILNIPGKNLRMNFQEVNYLVMKKTKYTDVKKTKNIVIKTFFFKFLFSLPLFPF